MRYNFHMSSRSFLLLIIFILILGAGYIYISRFEARNDFPLTEVPGEEPDSFRIALKETNGSVESGEAVFTEVSDTLTRVSINLQGTPENISEPAHLHSGTCASPGKVVHPLTSPMNGTSETVISASIESLRKGGLVLNVHKSGEDPSIYVACGKISPQ
jgi:hypothetical protein